MTIIARRSLYSFGICASWYSSRSPSGLFSRHSREWTEHKPGGYLPEYQDTQMPKETNDLRATIIRQRRPELYGALWGEGK